MDPFDDDWQASGDPDWELADLAVRAAAAALLATGPMPMAELVSRLDDMELLKLHKSAGEGDLEDEVDEALAFTDDFWVSASGIVATATSLLDGAVFTHRITARQLEGRIVDAFPDLMALVFGMRQFTLADGRPVSHEFPSSSDRPVDRDGSLCGPTAGWRGSETATL